MDKNKKFKQKGYYSAWLCRCECGTEKPVRQGHLVNGSSTNCGCVKKSKNGLSGTRIHHIYTDMIRRCYDEKSSNYKWYGAKGIKICQEWLDDFMNFYNWAIENGYNNDLTIDRIDSTKDYSPENCRWVTFIEQQNNKSNNTYININGIEKTIGEWSRISGIKYNTLLSRYYRDGIKGSELLKPVEK